MISRTAENCFWLSRNVERLLMLTNAIDVSYNVELETFKDGKEVWYPLVVVLGMEEMFLEKYSEADKANAKRIQEFLIWDKDNFSSVYSSLASARENARIIRDLISAEMWEEMNETWLWLNSIEAQNASKHSLLDFCHKLTKFCFTWIGFYHNFILRDSPYNFMKLGMLIERADFTVRLGDIFYYRNLNLGSMQKSMSESQYWQEFLQYTMSYDAFMRKSDLELSREDVVRFILKDGDYPRTVRFCLKDALTILKKVSDSSSAVGQNSKHSLDSLIEYVEKTSLDKILTNAHEFVTNVTNELGDISSTISKEFFIADVDYYIAMLEN